MSVLGMSLGDWLILALTCVFAGGTLNQWVFKRFPNHTIQKLSATFVVVLIISILTLASEGQVIYKALAGFMSLIYGCVLLGVGLDSWLDTIGPRSNGLK